MSYNNMINQIKKRINRIDNKLDFLKFNNKLGYTGPLRSIYTPSLKGFDLVDIDEQIDNIKYANDAIRLKQLLLDQN